MVNGPTHYERKSNKLRTAIEIFDRIKNWPTAFKMRLTQEKGLRLLEFRDGLHLIVRSEAQDWNVVHEVFFAKGYGLAMDWLRACKEPEPIVLDLGGNIGLFSLLAAQTHPGAKIITFEPGPPNVRIFRMNVLANEDLSKRITLREEAVAGASGEAVWYFDTVNAGASSLYGSPGSNAGLKVNIVEFAKVVAEQKGDIALVKIDIEGAEHDLLAKTPASTWQRIRAVAMELHEDPLGQKTPEQFWKEMQSLGYQIERESVCSYFLHR